MDAHPVRAQGADEPATEAVITDAPEKSGGAPAMPGGMDDF